MRGTYPQLAAFAELSMPTAALRSPTLYENLALFDALRSGNVRERALAQQLFEERL
jgi:hypothetical protein